MAQKRNRRMGDLTGKLGHEYYHVQDIQKYGAVGNLVNEALTGRHADITRQGIHINDDYSPMRGGSCPH
jgi:hypothetical protein